MIVKSCRRARAAARRIAGKSRYHDRDADWARVARAQADEKEMRDTCSEPSGK